LAQAAMAPGGSTDTLGLDAEEFAYAIAELVDEAMSNAARVHAVESGRALSDRTLIAFGGAAPLHVGRVADKLGIARVIVPVGAGVGSAIGFLLAPISYEVARSMYIRLQGFRPERVNVLLSSMADEARRVAAQGAEDRCLSEHRAAFARYVGQGHEIPIALPIRTLQESDAAVLRNAFEQSYLQQYGRLIDGVDIEILAWTVTVGADVPQVEPMATVKNQLASPPSSWRDIFDIGQAALIKAGLYRRSELSPGSTLAGPAVIVEESTSTVIGPGYDVAIAADASIVMTRRIIP
jgi:N-methylhydantoinase A